MAADELIMKLSAQFHKAKLQTVFLINNYDMTIAVLKVSCHVAQLHHPVALLVACFANHVSLWNIRKLAQMVVRYRCILRKC